jgi:uncharacterized protein
MMRKLIEIKGIDSKVYRETIRDFLPARVIDVHTHVWLERFRGKTNSDPARAVTWPARVAVDNPMEDLQETYRLMFPGKTVTPVIFGNNLSRADDAEGGNEYIRECAEKYHVPSLIFSMPWWSGAELERKVTAGGFLGAKVYLTLSDPKIPEKEIQIYDYLPHSHLEVLDQHGWIVMLHIPRDGRLRDPVNLRQMVEIEKRYPRVKVIIAHVGRAYCPEDVGNAFEILRETENMMFDISANTSGENFATLIRAVGPKRILFGSDLPITRMRMRRVCEHGNYVNLVPKGLYGDVSGDKHMREVDEELTFFMYEEILAVQWAVDQTGLGSGEIEDIFYNNAQRIFEGKVK